jgi:1-deoxy-D-xylulose-5-phosphate synthase
MAKPDKFHGLGKYQPDTGETAAGSTPTYSEIFGKTLADFADHNRKIVAVTAAMPNGTGLVQFANRHPDRFHDVGIAEEHAALFAAGMATRGMKPFVAIYSTFMQRAFDMIVHDIALQSLNVALCMDRAGLSGDDGPTHHGLFDIAYLRSIPGIIAMQAKDEEEFADMLWTMANHHEGPIAIRYPRGAGTGAVPKASPRILEIGKSEVLRHGTDIALFGLGNFCEVALEVADLLEKAGIKSAVINPRWIKPLDTGTLEFFARGTRLVCTLEDHAVTGGFGSAVAEHLSEAGITTPLVRVGWPDQFIEHGSVAILREKYGMTAKATAERILKALGQPASPKLSAL